MKKLIALILALLLTLVMFGCTGGKKDDENAGEPTPEPTYEEDDGQWSRLV